MQRIIENLTRQHRELVRVATELLGWLDVAKLQRDGASHAHRALSSLAGILKVHLAMEDRALYPGLLKHEDPRLRQLAERFLDERAAVARTFEDYRARWTTSAAIAIAPDEFIEETRSALGQLWNRMQLEDQVLHPEIVRTCS